MRNGLFGAIAALLAGAGMAAAQPLPSGPSPALPGGAGSVVSDMLDGPPPADDVFRPTQTASAYPYYAWARSEFLLWTIKKGSQPPPLLTTGPSTANNPAVLTDPTTIVLFPTGQVDYHAFEGGRWGVGTWFDPCEGCGAEVTGLLLVKRATTFAAASGAEAPAGPGRAVHRRANRPGERQLCVVPRPIRRRRRRSDLSGQPVGHGRDLLRRLWATPLSTAAGRFRSGTCEPTCSPVSASLASMKPST